MQKTIDYMYVLAGLPDSLGFAGRKRDIVDFPSMWLKVNPLVTNGYSYSYHLDEYIFIVRDIGSIFFIYISFFDENNLSKQNSCRWDAASQVCYSDCLLSHKKDARLIWVKVYEELPRFIFKFRLTFKDQNLSTYP